jgi:DNA-binding transcriptional MocR family regulator
MTAARTPGYQAILQRLQDDIATKTLLPGQLVPSHRAMAKACGVSTATVTRAYNEAIRLGLLVSIAGKGTRVAGPTRPHTLGPVSRPGLHNLAVNAPLAPRHLNGASVLHDAFARLAHGEAQALLTRVDQTREVPRHIEQAGTWLASLGACADKGSTFITPGAQSALLVALRTIASNGTAIACEPLIHGGLVAAADFVGAKLVAVACDSDGPLPDAIRTAVEVHGVRAIYASPTCSNPLAVHWSEARKRDISQLAKRLRLWIIEEDDCLPLDERASPLCSLAPERTIFVLGLSKIAGFALRTGFAWVPRALAIDYRHYLRASVWMASPLLAEVAVDWMACGTLKHWIDARRSEAAEHQSIAMQQLGRYGYRGYPFSMHGWLPLQLPWDSARFAHFARGRGVAVAPDADFRPWGGTSADMPQGVRLSLSSTQTTRQLHAALNGLAQLLDAGPRGDL